ncbi:ESCRT-III subunit protein snf7 [Hypoxylon texense]
MCTNVVTSVTGYSTHSAILTLQHDYPRETRVKVNADVALLLQKLNAEQTSVGQWVHVIGYITSIKQALTKATMESHMANVGVQALVLWIAEDLDIASYEHALASKAE